ncbi:MAG: SDR family NAD(P)-dependent oxidoreductase [Saprospiraceae bacterium]|nr:SDR family NAD(P)-dependent oxidoreductase [Bacteroidia bacterium]NNE14303.1 SDR family NAD(P)-dependent oxidoreductase [Saprospiraceae bacterium]NNL90849.1 SDR family NAD(P)-dependent oxidoreductase [Saprospiraceae bacterium]
MKKFVFITGVSSGIGLDATKALLSEGYAVIGTVRSVEDKVRLESEFKDDFKAVICDITDDIGLTKSINQVKEYLGDRSLFGLINNAGIVKAGPLNMISDDDFSYQMEVNLIATRKVTNKIIPMLKSNKNLKPRIIFISSISGVFAAPFNGPYCISKHALECMIDIYRRELKYLGIQVIGIQPGPIKTEIWRKSLGSLNQYLGGPYDKMLKNADHIIKSTEKAALDVEVISQKILKVMKMEHPSHRYMIRKGKALFKLISYYTPKHWVDKLIWKNLEKENPKNYRPV